MTYPKIIVSGIYPHFTNKTPTTFITSFSLDKGTEFRNKLFMDFCKKNDIKFIHNETSYHAAFAERFNGTLQKLIYAHVTESQSYTFYKSLQNFLNTYNNRKHR